MKDSTSRSVLSLFAALTIALLPLQIQAAECTTSALATGNKCDGTSCLSDNQCDSDFCDQTEGEFIGGLCYTPFFHKWWVITILVLMALCCLSTCVIVGRNFYKKNIAKQIMNAEFQRSLTQNAGYITDQTPQDQKGKQSFYTQRYGGNNV